MAGGYLDTSSMSQVHELVVHGPTPALVSATITTKVLTQIPTLPTPPSTHLPSPAPPMPNTASSLVSLWCHSTGCLFCLLLIQQQNTDTTGIWRPENLQRKTSGSFGSVAVADVVNTFSCYNWTIYGLAPLDNWDPHEKPKQQQQKNNRRPPSLGWMLFYSIGKKKQQQKL